MYIYLYKSIDNIANDSSHQLFSLILLPSSAVYKYCIQKTRHNDLLINKYNWVFINTKMNRFFVILRCIFSAYGLHVYVCDFACCNSSQFSGPDCWLSSCFREFFFFSEYNRPSMISLSNVCICIARERVLKKKKKGGKVIWLIYQHSAGSRKLMQDNWAHRESLAICAFRLYLRN